jgi:hypothetical protein
MALRRRRGAGPGRHRGGRAGLVALVVATYLGAGLVATWPALRSADDSFLAQGLPAREGAAAPGDHLQAVWQLWLPGHQLERGAAPWLDPYSFQPEVDPRPNFAGWPFGLVFWPLYALFGAVVGWNVFVLLSFAGAGVMTFLWLRELGLGEAGALSGGFAFALTPYLVSQSAMGHLLAPVSVLLPLSLYALERSRRGPDAWLALAGASLASIPLSGQVHFAVGAVPFFVLYAVLRRPVRIAGIAGCALAGLFGALAVYVASIRGSVGAGGRSFDQVERYSADLLDFLARDPRHGLESAVFLGWLVPLVAVVGAAALLLQGRYGLAGALLAGVVAPCLLALGANLPGYRDLWEHVPGLEETRVPARLMPIACLCLAGLVAAAADRLRRPALVAGLLVLLTLDLRLGVTRYHPSAADPDNEAYAALAEAGPGRLLELPVHLPDRQEASVYLHYAMQTPRERPAGYSTTAPKEADAAVRALREDPCSARALGVRYLAVFEPAKRPCSGVLIGEDGPVAVFRLREVSQARDRRR